MSFVERVDAREAKSRGGPLWQPSRRRALGNTQVRNATRKCVDQPRGKNQVPYLPPVDERRQSPGRATQSSQEGHVALHRAAPNSAPVRRRFSGSDRSCNSPGHRANVPEPGEETDFSLSRQGVPAARQRTTSCPERRWRVVMRWRTTPLSRRLLRGTGGDPGYDSRAAQNRRSGRGRTSRCNLQRDTYGQQRRAELRERQWQAAFEEDRARFGVVSEKERSR